MKRVISLSGEPMTLAEELLSGSPAGFERLYREQGSRMKSIAANLLGSRTDAEDAVHDTFVKVFRARQSYDGRHPLECWVTRILINTCYDRLRQRRRARPEDTVPEQSSHEDHALRAALEKAIEQLPLRQRTVFTLFQVEGFRHAEIAHVMDEREGTIRSLLFEAKRTLRQILRPAEGQP